MTIPVRRLRLAAATLLALAGPCPQAKSQTPTSPGDFLEKYYLEIHKPFFVPEKSADGRVLYRWRGGNHEPSAFEQPKDDGVMRVFIVGGSVAESVTSPAPGGARFEDVLGSSLRDARLELLNAGVSGYDSHRDALVAKEVLGYEPDLLIVMSGNNEFYNPVDLSPTLVALDLFLERRISFYARLKRRKGYSPPPPISLETRLEQFRANLRSILSLAQRRGATVALCTLPVNPLKLPPTNESWRRPGFARAWLALDAKRYALAGRLFADYLRRFPDEPAALEYAARALEGTGKRDEAARYRAESLDRQEARCGPAKNRVIREVCRPPGCVLADLDEAFARLERSPARTRAMFIDGVHWALDYNRLVAGVVASALHAREPDRWAAPPPFSAAPDGKGSARRMLAKAVDDAAHKTSAEREESAIEGFEESFRLAPELFDEVRARPPQTAVLNSAGEALRRLGRDRQALALLDRSLQLQPDQTWAYLYRGLARRRRGLPSADDDFRILRARADSAVAAFLNP